MRSTQRPQSSVLAYYHRPFVIHSLHDFNTREMLQVVFYIFGGMIPAPFQILHCSSTTEKSELELFFTRVKFWKEHQYVIVGVDRLSSRLQEARYCTCLWKYKAKDAHGNFQELFFIYYLHFLFPYFS